MPPLVYGPVIVLDGLLCCLTVASILLGVYAIATGRRPFPSVLWRFARQSGHAPEVVRLSGMSLTLSSMGGLLVALQIAWVTLFMANGWPMAHTPVSAAIALAIVVGLLLLEVMFIGAGFAVNYDVLGRLATTTRGIDFSGAWSFAEQSLSG